jgi:hypothetical protein
MRVLSSCAYAVIPAKAGIYILRLDPTSPVRQAQGGE